MDFNKGFGQPKIKPDLIRNKSIVDSGVVSTIETALKVSQKEKIRALRDKILDIESEFGEGMQEKIASVYEYAAEVFRERGYSGEVVLAPSVLIDPKEENPHALAKFSPMTGYVEIGRKNIEDKELAQVDFLRRLGHELYHSAAPSTLNVISTGNNSVGIAWDAHGAGTHRNGKEGSAFEEGLAVRFEDSVFEKTKRLFSESVIKKYDNLMVGLQGVVIEGIEDIDLQRFSIHENVNGATSFTYSSYADAKRLVDLVASKIPDFDRMVEDC